jgi:hypothetical protein
MIHITIRIWFWTQGRWPCVDYGWHIPEGMRLEPQLTRQRLALTSDDPFHVGETYS